MPDDATRTDYLAQGGRLTTPDNVPPRYRAELMKLMSTFVDSQLAGAAGFVGTINQSPGNAARIAAARIVLEKNENARRVLALMGEFGTNIARYGAGHRWEDRLARDAQPEARRNGQDMRLSVLNYPLEGWVDAVTMNCVVGHAIIVQMTNLARVSYQPFADVMKELLPVERGHAASAEKGLAHIVAEGHNEDIAQSLAYWRPRAAEVFGDPSPARLAQLQAWGLRHSAADHMRAEWQRALDAAFARIGVS